jgi:hypothetical protein
LFTACSIPKHYDKLENKQQQSFDTFLLSKRAKEYNQANDIQKKQFYSEFENELYGYIDSVKLFVNWNGRISDIKTESNGKSTYVKFKITYQPEEYRKISFFCTHLAKSDSLNDDYIYNKVKSIPDNSEVYFDGFIRTKNNNKVDYHLGNPGEDLNIAYPDYKFWIIDISNTKRNDTLTSNLKNTVDCCYKITQPLKQLYLKQISKSESDKQHRNLLPAFEILKSKLSNDEIKYVQRLNTCLVYNFLFGE